MTHLDDQFYNRAVRSLPIVCVDLLVTNPKDEILLVQRLNPPAQNEWWFPGGRTLIGETRDQAVPRKLLQECGLSVIKAIDLGTYDLILKRPDDTTAHAVTTLYHVFANGKVEIDWQSSDFAWKPANEWLKILKDEWLCARINEYKSHQFSSKHLR